MFHCGPSINMTSYNVYPLRTDLFLYFLNVLCSSCWTCLPLCHVSVLTLCSHICSLSFISCKIHPTFFLELVNNYMSSVFTSVAACSIMGLEAKLVSAANSHKWIWPNARAGTKRNKKDRVAGNRREGDMHIGQFEAAADWHIHRRLFILSCSFCCSTWQNCVVGLSFTDGWRPSSNCLVLALNWCIKMAKRIYFHLSIPIKLNQFQKRKTGLLCRRMPFVQRLKPLNICFEWAKKISTRQWIRRETVSATECEEKLCFLLSDAAPTRVRSRHKEKHSWHTYTCTHMETVCKERRVPGWRFCWVRSRKHCRCLKRLFPFNVICRSPRWGQRFDGSHSDIRVLAISNVHTAVWWIVETVLLSQNLCLIL